MKHKRQKEGWPWERPGYQFYTDACRAWLGGYEPTMAAEMCRKKRGGDGARSTEVRDKAILAGEAWAKGTLYGLNSVHDDGKKMRMLKPSNLG